MKTMKNQKLTLNKETISNLEMGNLKGGIFTERWTDAPRICRPYQSSICISDSVDCPEETTAC